MTDKNMINTNIEQARQQLVETICKLSFGKVSIEEAIHKVYYFADFYRHLISDLLMQKHHDDAEIFRLKSHIEYLLDSNEKLTAFEIIKDIVNGKGENALLDVTNIVNGVNIRLELPND